MAVSPAWICWKMSSSLAPPLMAWASRPSEATRCQCSRVAATLEAVFSSGATTKRSPAMATSERPSTWTGVDGPASLTCLPWSSMSARTRPQAAPATSGSPTLRVPRCTRIVATGPRPMSRLDSSTTPRARPSGVARRSSSSATHEQVVEQVVDAEVLQGGDLDHDGVAAPGLGDEAVLGELLHDPVGVGVLAVDLVDGHDDRDLGRLGVVERLDGLGHHAVVGRHHQDDDVGGLGATGPHGGERLVARGVDEGDGLAVLGRPGRHRCAG